MKGELRHVKSNFENITENREMTFFAQQITDHRWVFLKDDIGFELNFTKTAERVSSLADFTLQWLV